MVLLGLLVVGVGHRVDEELRVHAALVQGVAYGHQGCEALHALLTGAVAPAVVPVGRRGHLLLLRAPAGPGRAPGVRRGAKVSLLVAEHVLQVLLWLLTLVGIARGEEESAVVVPA